MAGDHRARPSTALGMTNVIQANPNQRDPIEPHTQKKVI